MAQPGGFATLRILFANIFGLFITLWRIRA